MQCEGGYCFMRLSCMTVDYEGHVLAASDFFTTDQQVMVAYVPLYGVHTIYAAIGDLFAWVCLFGVVALTGLAILQSRRRQYATARPMPESQLASH